MYIKVLFSELLFQVLVFSAMDQLQYGPFFQKPPTIRGFLAHDTQYVILVINEMPSDTHPSGRNKILKQISRETHNTIMDFLKTYLTELNIRFREFPHTFYPGILNHELFFTDLTGTQNYFSLRINESTMQTIIDMANNTGKRRRESDF